MYQVESQGKIVGEFEHVVFIRLNRNGCYAPCDEALAEGVCVKLPRQEEREVVNDDTGKTTTETVTVYEDTVFAFADGGLTGKEPVAVVRNKGDSE